MQVLVLLCCVCVVCSMKLPDGKSAVISDTNNVTQELVKSVISEGIQNNGKVPENCEQDCVTDEDKFEARDGGGGGGKRKKKKQQDLMSRILPMMIIPFMIQTAMIPMALTALKFMLIKSAIIGKLAILLSLLNALRQRQNNGGVYSHNINIGEDTKKIHQEHYGYYGAPEYGAWVNR